MAVTLNCRKVVVSSHLGELKSKWFDNMIKLYIYKYKLK